ncbi:MAG TPA: POT family MFS transporter [Planctomycetaceae bacterium]
MPNTPYLTAPIATTKMPPGIPYIIGNEAAERFSFYGMRTILVVFMTRFLLDSHGNDKFMTNEEAKYYYHLFVASAYFFPVLGAILSDVWLGKYPTIISLSLVYCLGHAALAVDDTRMGLFAGLALIAIGAGGIKPCVSAHVGDQFGKSNAHLLERVYGWFYFSINFGSFFSTILTPWLLEECPKWLIKHFGVVSPEAISKLQRLGPHLAFGVPGLLMLIATIVFWIGRYKFAHIPPRGIKEVALALRGEGSLALLKLVPIFIFVAMFWSLYDQTGSAWVLQADQMDRTWLRHEWLSSQIQAINPLLILVLMPFFSYVGYPAINKVFRLTPLRKMSVGLFLTVAAFTISSIAQEQIDAGKTPNIVWQLAAYVVITASEVMVSITGLEFSYTQAPRELKSVVMSMWLLTVSLGNVFTMFVNKFIQNPDGSVKLAGAAYFWFFTILMFGAAVLFIVVAWLYREKTYIQEERPATTVG